MCGITGKIYYDTRHFVELSELKQMTDSIRHRGPDDEGHFIDKNVGLGFRRLSIIDLKSGHQPLCDKSSRYWITFNGEIYNFKEERTKLEKKGYVFKTNTDTEVIVNLYAEYKEKCVDYLRGMFAFVIWDKSERELFCARDRFGIKPFYYYSDNQKFVFGSEIKSILQAENIDKSLSYNALDSYFAFGYITSDLSIYSSIKKLQPGHCMLLSINDKPKLEIKKYWEIDFQPDYAKTENQWVEEIEYCLSEAVKLHMISDVPLGAFLSGGIDSSSVVAMMAKNSNLPIQTFSIGFKEQTYNELKYAREIATKYNCDYHEQIVEPESISVLSKLVSVYDEPFADASAIPTYVVSKFAREFVTVALSGDGGDELFAGYTIYRYLQKINKYNSPSPFFNKNVWGTINKMIPQKISGKGLSYFLSQNKEYLGAYLSIWNKNERKRLIRNNKMTLDYNYNAEMFKQNILSKSKSNDFIANLQYLDMQTYMVDDILTKVDRASMLSSLEVRVPLLDHKFAELTFKIPWNLKIKGKVQKYIFRKAMSNFLPKNVFNHAKQGFSMPLSIWFKGDLKEYINDTLNPQNTLLSEYVNMNEVRETIKNHHTGMRDFNNKIWSLLFFNEWLKQNMD